MPASYYVACTVLALLLFAFGKMCIRDSTLYSTLFGALAIVCGVILVGSVSLIYNAFAISLAERGRTFGMLSSVGATRRQKRGSVFFEAEMCIRDRPGAAP